MFVELYLIPLIKHKLIIKIKNNHITIYKNNYYIEWPCSMKSPLTV